MLIARLTALACISLSAGLCQQAQDWSHYVRIGGYGAPTPANADRTVKGAADTYVFGIEVDNDITGRYESFLDPKEKLEGIKAVATKAHEAGNYAFVYMYHRQRRYQGAHHGQGPPRLAAAQYQG